MDMRQEFNKSFAQLELGNKVLVAVSTGVDSMTLVDLLLSMPAEIKPQIFIAYVDHQLRKQSIAETEFIQNFCQENSLPLFVKKWCSKDHPNNGIEAAARNFRYAFFKEIMKKENITDALTAHHADDQAETFLMKLVRGGELKQLTGIETQRCFEDVGRISRPLLGFSKGRIRAYATKHKLQYFEDHTNQDDDVFRNRLRHQIIPKLKKENDKFLQHIAGYEGQIKQLLSVVDGIGREKMSSIKSEANSYSVSKWNALSQDWREIVLKMVIQSIQKAYSVQQLAQIDALLKNKNKPQGYVELGEGIVFVKLYDKFFLKQKESTQTISQGVRKLKLDEWVELSDGSKIGIFLHNKPATEAEDEFFFFSDVTYLPLMLRHRRPGDVLQTAIGHQKVKKIMIDKKMANEKRKNTWLLTTNSNRVIWLPGIKKSNLSECQSNDKIQYMIIFRRRRQG
ncbi:tRNA lysidine(34) synthetase TilS [Liquorilactobacillus uvarum]|uniref:tRNA lysidine(34) synthetase TilS n=1 Tax=Liquorilactobacillus uvarum TaxID=303240 RepID=UPI00288A59F5|nr:tRNA lysidine(34) synthetase TilS [Liquorilactobacillus uvarum]